MIHVFVGGSPSEVIQSLVLDASIRRHTNCPVDIHLNCFTPPDIPTPKNPAYRARTKFSFQRLALPEQRNRRGKAIYLDSDMLVYGDIGEMWDLPTEGNHVLRTPHQTAVLLVDCEHCPWNLNDLVNRLDSGALDYNQAINELDNVKVGKTLPKHWNHLDRKQSDTALLHYTDLKTQPWKYAKHPFGYLWIEALAQAIQEGRFTLSFLAGEIQKGYCRPGVMAEVKHLLG